MESKPPSDSALTRDDEREANVMLDQALKQVERGVDSQEALTSILALLPSHMHGEVKRRFARKMDEKKGKKPVQPLAAKQAIGLKQALTLVAQKAYEKITSVFKSKPDIQKLVVSEGKILLKNGVVVDMIRLSDTDLGTLPPAAGIAQAQSPQTGR